MSRLKRFLLAAAAALLLAVLSGCLPVDADEGPSRPAPRTEDNTMKLLALSGFSAESPSVKRIEFIEKGTVQADRIAEQAVNISASGTGELWAGLKDGVLYVVCGETAYAPVNSMGLFMDFGSVEEIRFNGLFSTSGVTNMSYLFEGCRSLRTLELGSFDTSAVTDMTYMFAGNRSLRRLELDGLDTSAVTDMTGMFLECFALEELDLSGFDTSEVQSMERMFSGCRGLKELDLSGFDTASVTGMRSMFDGCRELETLDVSSFDTARVEDMAYMFALCSGLEELDLSNFDTTAVTDLSQMFLECEAGIRTGGDPALAHVSETGEG